MGRGVTLPVFLRFTNRSSRPMKRAINTQVGSLLRGLPDNNRPAKVRLFPHSASVEHELFFLKHIKNVRNGSF